MEVTAPPTNRHRSSEAAGVPHVWTQLTLPRAVSALSVHRAPRWPPLSRSRPHHLTGSETRDGKILSYFGYIPFLAKIRCTSGSAAGLGTTNEGRCGNSHIA